MAGMFNDENNTFITRLLLCNNSLSCTPSAMYEGCFCASYYVLVVKLISLSLKDAQCLNKECINDVAYQIVRYAYSNYMDSVYKYELKLAINYNLAKGANQKEKEFFFINTLSRNDEWIKYFFEKYPNLTHLLETYTYRIINYVTSFSHKFEEEKSQLNDFFELEESNIEKVKMFSGDIHFGKCVMAVDFDCGKRLYYKPRNADNEQFLVDYIRFLSTLGLKIKLRIPEFKNYKDHSWHIHKTYGSELNDRSDLTTYYHNWGVLLCAFYFLNSQDIIPDNILFSDNQPCILDCEALINSPIPYQDTTPLVQYIQNSVIRTGILPDWMFSKIEERNRISSVLFKFNTENLHLPRYKQECLPISRELSSFFLAGFKYAYDLMLKHKELILDFFNAYNFNAVTSRVLLHPTIIYTFLLKEYTTPEYLSGVKKISTLLSTIVTEKAFGKYKDQIVHSILRQIENGDIPCFYTRFGDSGLYVNQRILIKEWLEEKGSLLTSLLQKTKKASLTDCHYQCNIIIETLHFFLDVIDDTSNLYRLRPSKFDKFQTFNSDILDAVKHISERITKKAIEIEDEIGFMCRTKNIYDGVFQVSLMNDSIYGGLAGLCMFYRTLYNYIKDPEYLKLSHKLFKQLCSNCLIETDVKDRIIPLSPLSGITGLLYIMELFPNDFYNKAVYDDIIERIKRLIPITTQFDYMSGLTGLIMFIIQCKLIKYQDKRLLLQTSGNRLLELANSKEGMLHWTYLDGVRGREEKLVLGGFSHGSSAIAVAFRILYEEFNDSSFMSAFQKTLLHDRSFYDEGIRGWRDGREYINNQDTGSWCHGAAGIALSRIMLIPFFEKDSLVFKELTIAESQVEKRLGYNLSVCHGTMGNIEILKAIDSALYDGHKYEVRIREWINSIVKLIKDEDRILCGDDNLDSQLSMFMGYAGIGYQLLRMYDWQHIPSIMCLETNPFINHLHK
ncbi:MULTISPECIES: type 2 lanthipeptide synthetase LanM [Prevotella]|jgi:type 2 lantibiotic biosynthesis protein lanM|uniref:type 2 lanthipeptide synthetase LanM n=1 Tax=Prevotella TaxID=838 RepID=UPI00241F6E67|nr:MULTISPECIES: type 2 lanthipeptide synthetase LanM [Prevotella]